MNLAQAGDLVVHGIPYPRMQLLTVPELLDGQRLQTPTVAAGRHEVQPRMPGMPV